MNPVTDSIISCANREPWGYYDRQRSEHEIVWDEGMRSWLVFSYDLIKEIALGEHELWDLSYVDRDDVEAPIGLERDAWHDFIGFGSRRFLMTEKGDSHMRQHRWFMRAFAPTAARRWTDTVFRPIVNAQIDRFAGAGRAELVEDYSRRVAPRTISAMLGLPHEDDDWVEHVESLMVDRLAVKTLVGLPDPDPELIRRGFAATEELTRILVPYVEERRGGNGDDFISMLWAAGDELFGEGFTAVDVLGAAGVAWEGGSGTTAYSTANALYLMLTQPEMAADVRSADEKRLAGYVEETIRLFGPVHVRPRVARQDIEIGGQLIRKGEQVLTLLVAANRDPAHYPDAGEVDVARRSPRDHLSFFFGPRTCPGQGLARVELALILKTIVDRLPDMRLDPDAEPPYYSGTMTRRWEPLHALFTPTA
jgi:cytochrome P450